MQKMRCTDLDLANRLQNKEDKEALLEELSIQQEKRKVSEATRAAKQAVAVLAKASENCSRRCPGLPTERSYVDMCKKITLWRIFIHM